VERNYQRAKEILTTNRPLLQNVAETLLEREVLDAEEVKMVIDGVPLKDRTPTPEEANASGEEPKGEEKKTPLTPPMLPNPKSVPQS
jgi:cell division protease FtsH